LKYFVLFFPVHFFDSQLDFKTQVDWIGNKTTTPIYEGDKIKVIYNPKNPNEVIVESFGGIWGSTIALGLYSTQKHQNEHN
jgi:hypothetical protein